MEHHKHSFAIKCTRRRCKNPPEWRMGGWLSCTQHRAFEQNRLSRLLKIDLNPVFTYEPANTRGEQLMHIIDLFWARVECLYEANAYPALRELHMMPTALDVGVALLKREFPDDLLLQAVFVAASYLHDSPAPTSLDK